MDNDGIIKSEIFETEGSDLSGNKNGTCITSTEFINENRVVLALFSPEKKRYNHAYHEFCNILAELVKRETIARIQKSLDNIKLSNF